jgi:hypothetical protein
MTRETVLTAIANILLNYTVKIQVSFHLCSARRLEVITLFLPRKKACPSKGGVNIGQLVPRRAADKG